MNWYLWEDCSDCSLSDYIYFFSCLLCSISRNKVVLLSVIELVSCERIPDTDNVWRTTC